MELELPLANSKRHHRPISTDWMAFGEVVHILGKTVGKNEFTTKSKDSNRIIRTADRNKMNNWLALNPNEVALSMTRSSIKGGS